LYRELISHSASGLKLIGARHAQVSTTQSPQPRPLRSHMTLYAHDTRKCVMHTPGDIPALSDLENRIEGSHCRIYTPGSLCARDYLLGLGSVRAKVAAVFHSGELSRVVFFFIESCNLAILGSCSLTLTCVSLMPLCSGRV
jgi:hypothetical protein